jgi:hypothetical protein
VLVSQGQFNLEGTEKYAQQKWMELVWGKKSDGGGGEDEKEEEKEEKEENGQGVAGVCGKAQLCDAVYSYFFAWLAATDDASLFETSMKSVLDMIREPVVTGVMAERRSRQVRWAQMSCDTIELSKADMAQQLEDAVAEASEPVKYVFLPLEQVNRCVHHACISRTSNA